MHVVSVECMGRPHDLNTMNVVQNPSSQQKSNSSALKTALGMMYKASKAC